MSNSLLNNHDERTLEYVAGSSVNLTCMVTPPPPPNSEFSWNCSASCLEGVEMGQTINLADVKRIESGVLNCLMTISGNNFQSPSFQLTVFGKTLRIYIQYTALQHCGHVCILCVCMCSVQHS